MLHAERGAGHDGALARSVQHRPPGRAPAREVDPAARILRVERAAICAVTRWVAAGFAIGRGRTAHRGRVKRSRARGRWRSQRALGISRRRGGIGGAVNGGSRGCRIHTDHVMAVVSMRRACACTRGMVKTATRFRGNENRPNGPGAGADIQPPWLAVRVDIQTPPAGSPQPGPQPHGPSRGPMRAYDAAKGVGGYSIGAGDSSCADAILSMLFSEGSWGSME